MAKEDNEAAYFKCDSCGENWPISEQVKTTRTIIAPGAKKGEKIKEIPSLICRRCAETIKGRKRHCF